MMYKWRATWAKLLQSYQRKKAIIIIGIESDNYFHLRIVVHNITKIIFSVYLHSYSCEQTDLFVKI